MACMCAARAVKSGYHSFGKKIADARVALSFTFQTASSKSTLEGFKKDGAPARTPQTQAPNLFAVTLRKGLIWNVRAAQDQVGNKRAVLVARIAAAG